MAQDPDTRSKYSDIFFNYLLSECWPKMYQRISTSPPLAFIYGLLTHWQSFQVLIRQFKWDDPEFAHPGPGDSTLASCINANAEEFVLLEGAFGHEAPKGYQCFLEDHKGFKNLISAAQSCLGPEKRALYTKDSAESFHQFLVAALVMYTISINKLRHTFKNPASQTGEEQETIRLA